MASTQSFLSQFLQRLVSETPIFFRKIVYFGISLGAIGLALKGVDLGGIKLPFNLDTISGYMIAIGTVCTIIAKSATTDPNLQAKGGSNVDVNQAKDPPVSTSVSKAP